MNRGVTVLRGYSYYTGDEKDVLYIVITKQELTMLKKIVRYEDKNAFLSIHDVKDVFGEEIIDISGGRDGTIDGVSSRVICKHHKRARIPAARFQHAEGDQQHTESTLSSLEAIPRI